MSKDINTLCISWICSTGTLVAEFTDTSRAIATAFVEDGGGKLNNNNLGLKTVLI